MRAGGPAARHTPWLSTAGRPTGSGCATITCVNALLTARSACQDGVFTVRDAAACGVDARTLRRLVAAGTVVRVAPSAYADGLRYAAGSAEQRHALTARAVVLTFQGRAVASHASALTVLGIPVLDADLGRVHLARTADDLSRRGRYIVLHGSYGPGTWCPGEPCVAPALAVLGNAMVSGTESGAAAMDRALATGLVTAADLQAGLERLASWPGVGKARLAVALADGRAESVGETRARLLLGAIGFADLVPQARIADADGHVVARVDFLLGGRVVVEFDGAVKYDGVEGRAALVAEKRREDRLRSMGYEVVRLVWADLSDPLRVRLLVRSALARARMAA